MKRRAFLQSAAAISSIGMLSSRRVLADDESSATPWLRKTLKLGMVNVPGTMTDKFAAAKEAGFEGIETGRPRGKRRSC